MAEQDVREFELDPESAAKTLARAEKVAARGLDGGWKVTRAVVLRGVEGDPRNPRREAVILRVTGTPAKIKGWRLIAAYDLEQGGVVIRRLPGFTGEIDRDTLGNSCRHCGHDRRRTHLVLLESEESGEQVTIGTTCVKDFLGHAWKTSWASDPADVVTERSLGGFGQSRPGVLSTVTMSAALIRHYGWVSKGAAYTDERLQSTAARLWNKESWNPRDGATVLDEDKESAQAALEWIKTVDASKSEYLANLQIICASDFYNPKHTGIVASLVSSHQRELGRQAQRKAEAGMVTNAQYGTLGKRFRGVPVEVVRVHSTEGCYGTTHIHTFKVIETGHQLTWFTGSVLLKAKAVGRLDGTPKETKVFRGLTSTTVTRCKFEG